MDNLQQQKEKNTKSSININSDFDLDHLEFRPINKGLGFHQNTNKDRVGPVKRKVIVNSNTLENQKRSRLEARTNSKVSLGTYKNGTDPIYDKKEFLLNEEKKVTSTDKEISVKNVDLSIKASKFEIFVAWLIDLVIVLFFLAVTGIFLILGSGIDLDLIESLINKQEIYLFGGLLFIFYYFLYFTVLDVSGTPGKNTLGLKVVDESGKTVRMKSLFVRTSLSLVSFILLGLPNVLNIHGAVSKTSVIKR
ncbi:MAG: RDD family protein [Halobacteriovoraceae bacterium]|nr:RDD family protein [Halobacteriovoraceae bacterium]